MQSKVNKQDILTLKEFLEFKEAFDLKDFIGNLNDEKLIDVFKRTWIEFLKLADNGKTPETKKETMFELGYYLLALKQRDLLNKGFQAILKIS